MDTNSISINGKSLLELIPARVGGKLVWTSVTALTIGTASEDTVFSDDTGALLMSFNGTLSCAITTTGAGGLQTSSSEASDTWYGVYIIGDTTLSNTPKILLIPDGTAFSESGYNVKKRVGWIRNDGSSDFVHVKQIGTGSDRTHFILEVIADRRPLNNGSATTSTSVDCSAFIPPSVLHAMFNVQFETGSSGAASDSGNINDPEAASNSLIRVRQGVVSAEKCSMEIQCPVDSGQNIEYKVTQGGANENRLTLIVTGYVDNL